MPQHRHRQRRIIRLMCTGQGGDGQCKFPRSVTVMDRAARNLCPPIEIAQCRAGACLHRAINHDFGSIQWIGLGDERHPRFGDTRLFKRDPGQWFRRNAVFWGE